MLMKQERREIVRYLQRMLMRGLTRGTGGNISVRSADGGAVAISPSGVDYEELTPEDVPVTDLAGRVLEGPDNPSSELALHLIFYRNRPEVGAVVHTHSTWACVLAALGWELPACSYLLGLSGGDVRCTDYVPFGTEALAKAALAGCEGRNAVLLGSHGLVAVGRDLKCAFACAEQTEFVCEIYGRASALGQVKLLTPEQMDEAVKKLDTYLK